MLLHRLKQAPLSGKIFKQAIKRGLEIPKEFSSEAPNVLPWLEIYWKAFDDLINDRRTEHAPIEWMTRQKWAEVHQLDEVQTELLHKHIVAMDLAFLGYLRNKRSQQQPPNPPAAEEKPSGVV